MKPSFEFEQVLLRDIAELGDAALLHRYQRQNIVVLDVPLGECNLHTLVAIAPNGHYFGQEWWMGQSYIDWSQNLAADRSAANDVVQSVRSLGVAYESLPMQMVGLGGWFYHAFGKGMSAWNSDIVISATIPTKVVPTAIQVIESSLTLMSQYLLPRTGALSKTRIGEKYGEVILEQAFPISSSDGVIYRTMYREPGECDLTQQTFSQSAHRQQERQLTSHMKALRALLKESSTGFRAYDGAQRQQFLFFLSAPEFDVSLHDMVREVNAMRAEVLATIDIPHFFLSLELRLPDIDNKPKKRLNYLPNDEDWMSWLMEAAPESFSSRRGAKSSVDRYLKTMRTAFPCLGTDPFKGVLSATSRKRVKKSR